MKKLMNYKEPPMTFKPDNTFMNFGNIPASYDARDYGQVSPVKDQMFCGASWAYAAASAMESAYRNMTGFSFTVSY